MTKQPILTGFPSSLLATSKRRLQANIRAAKDKITSGNLTGYSSLFSDILLASFLAEHDPTQQQRSFGHIPVFSVFWAWLAQLLEANASCSKALGLIQSWYQASAIHRGLPLSCIHPTENRQTS